jgi:hypothetical protein
MGWNVERHTAELILGFEETDGFVISLDGTVQSSLQFDLIENAEHRFATNRTDCR